MKYRHFRFGDIDFRRIAAVAAVLCVATVTAHAGPRAVVELFTSQGCSACPPADRLLSELAKDPSLVTMSLPIDYWDYLGWKDTLAHHSHTTRQRAYSVGRGDREVYTPQVVINGVAHALGSDRAAIERAIVKTRAEDAPLALAVSVTVSGDTVTVKVPAAEGAAHSGEVWLCAVTGQVLVKIGRGENRGSTVTYTNVVRSRVKLGDWNGKAQTFTYKVAALPQGDVTLADIDHLDAILQSGSGSKPGLMLGVARASLR